MQRCSFLTAASALAVTVVSLPSFAEAAVESTSSPLLAPWTGPHGGVPPFDRVKVEEFKAALLASMDVHRTETARIAASTAAPTFENTVLALETSGRELARVGTLFGTFTSTMNRGSMRKLQVEMTPILAAFSDEQIQNSTVFARIKAVYDVRATSGLSPEAQRLTDVVYTHYVSEGAALDAPRKKQLAAINQKLASLYTQFSQNELADEESGVLVLDRKSDLAGLSDQLEAGAAQAAGEHGHAGKWVITNTRSSMEPFLTYASHRDLRERGWRMWISRGDNNDAHDNKAAITSILQLRAQKAQLLGFPTYAHWSTSTNMAKTPDAAMALMMRVWPAAVARAREEVADMQAIVVAEGGTFKIAPWDYRFYAEKVRKAKYDLDQNEVKQYLALDNVRKGMFWTAGQLYGFEFVPVTDVPVYQPDMTVYDVRRGGEHVGLWYFDPYAREGKNSGAWMSEYRTQERATGAVTPIVSNNSNFIKAAPGQPVLISWSDAVTMFHEFGHALHGLNSSVTYPTLAGTAVARDFVEFPSQLNERWLPTREVLDRFALHHETGKPMPPELIAKIAKARTFNQGFGTVEYLSSALYDMKIHLAATGQAIDPAAFEKSAMAELEMPSEIVMRHRPTHFGHIFAGEGYAAGYYDYIWADTLTADAYEAFTEAGGPWDKMVAKRLHDSIMSVGNTITAQEAFHRFRGRDVNPEALMRDRGFPVTA